jgi:phosphoserine phosphatase
VTALPSAPSATGRTAVPAAAPVEIYLIRHGETEWNERGLFQGTADIPLSERGREQAEALRERLRGVGFDAAYGSPLVRATATAEAVLAGSGVPLRTLPELREISYGLWQGRGSLPAGRCNPGLEWRWKHDPWTVRFPGGETLEEVRLRAAAALERIVDAHPGETVLVCGHGHLNRVLLIHALGWPRDRFWSIPQPNACCYRVTLGPDRAEAEPV